MTCFSQFPGLQCNSGVTSPKACCSALSVTLFCICTVLQQVRNYKDVNIQLQTSIAGRLPACQRSMVKLSGGCWYIWLSLTHKWSRFQMSIILCLQNRNQIKDREVSCLSTHCCNWSSPPESGWEREKLLILTTEYCVYHNHCNLK